MSTRHEGLDVRKIAGAVSGVLDSLGNVEMGGIKLERPDAEMLNLNSDRIPMDVHAAMHPACVAYYGALRKEALRELAVLKTAYERWRLKMWAEAKVKACGGSSQYKPTVNDIEARLIVDHEKELEDWDERLEAAQKLADDMESWFEAWRQKSFAMKDHAHIDEEERYAAGGGSLKGRDGGAPEAGGNRMQRVREIIRRRREASGGASV